jgi:hypothetical protein
MKGYEAWQSQAKAIGGSCGRMQHLFGPSLFPLFTEVRGGSTLAIQAA